MNKSFLAGRLTADPTMRYTGTNIPVASFKIAVPRKYAREGEQNADFIPITAWNKTAEFCSKYFRKGQKVIVFGRIQTRTWDDNDGKKHYVTEIVAEEVDFADGKKDSSNNNNSSQYSYSASQDSGVFPEYEDDELPF